MVTPTTTMLNTIRQKIASADHAYYTIGKSIVDDAVYDCWKDTLKKACPHDPLLHRVGSPISDNILVKRKHSIPMGSQNKASNKAEFYEWLNKLENRN